MKIKTFKNSLTFMWYTPAVEELLLEQDKQVIFKGNEMSNWKDFRKVAHIVKDGQRITSIGPAAKDYPLGPVSDDELVLFLAAPFEEAPVPYDMGAFKRNLGRIGAHVEITSDSEELPNAPDGLREVARAATRAARRSLVPA